MTTAKRLNTFRHDGLTFEAIDSGPLDGDIVVLLHGWPLDMHCWKAVREQLNRQGFRTIAPNQRGYSSDAQPRGRWAYRMSKLVADVAALIHQLGDQPVHLVGHDWGSTVAWSLAAKHPALIRSLTSLSVPHSGAFMRAMLSSDQLLRVYYMGLFQLPLLPEWFIRHWPAAVKKMLIGNGLATEQADSVYHDLVHSNAVAGSLNWYRAMPFTSPGSLRAKITVPTVHVLGEKDTAITQRSAELTEKFVEAAYQLRILPNATHWLPLQQPDDVSTAIIDSIAQAA